MPDTDPLAGLESAGAIAQQANDILFSNRKKQFELNDSASSLGALQALGQPDILALLQGGGGALPSVQPQNMGVAATAPTPAPGTPSMPASPQPAASLIQNVLQGTATGPTGAPLPQQPQLGGAGATPAPGIPGAQPPSAPSPSASTGLSLPAIIQGLRARQASGNPLPPQVVAKLLGLITPMMSAQETGLRKGLQDQRLAQQVAVGADAGSALLTGDDLDYAAQQYRRTGTMPPQGLGATGVPAQNRANIIRRARELEQAEKGGAGLSSGAIAGSEDIRKRADTKANASALTAVVKWAAGVDRSAEVIENQLKIARQYLDRLPLSTVQSINRAIVAGAKEFGSGDANSYGQAMYTASTEFGRMLTGPLSQGMLAEGAAQRSIDRLNTGLTKGQFADIQKLFTQEIGGIKKANQDQIDELEGRLSGGGGAAPAGNTAGNTTGGAQQQFVEGKIYVDGQGQRARYQDGQFVPVQ